MEVRLFKTIAALMVFNVTDYLTTYAACSTYACSELNGWVLRYPVVKFMVPGLFTLSVYTLERRGVVKRGTTLIAVLILTAVFIAATINNIIVTLK